MNCPEGGILQLFWLTEHHHIVRERHNHTVEPIEHTKWPKRRQHANIEKSDLRPQSMSCCPGRGLARLLTCHVECFVQLQPRKRPAACSQALWEVRNVLDPEGKENPKSVHPKQPSNRTFAKSTAHFDGIFRKFNSFYPLEVFLGFP